MPAKSGKKRCIEATENNPVTITPPTRKGGLEAVRVYGLLWYERPPAGAEVLCTCTDPDHRVEAGVWCEECAGVLRRNALRAYVADKLSRRMREPMPERKEGFEIDLDGPDPDSE